MYAHGLILPVLALVAWTFVMWVWMYATRIPAMQRTNIDPQEIVSRGAKLELPPEVTRVADNYNHLHEQPTIFYAVALAAQVAGVQRHHQRHSRLGVRRAARRALVRPGDAEHRHAALFDLHPRFPPIARPAHSHADGLPD